MLTTTSTCLSDVCHHITFLNYADLKQYSKNKYTKPNQMPPLHFPFDPCIITVSPGSPVGPGLPCTDRSQGARREIRSKVIMHGQVIF